MKLSPGPGRTEASTTSTTTSTSRMASRAVSTIRTFIRWVGLWIPGVSTNTAWASGYCLTPTIRVRVVWGLSETIASFWPTMRLSSVDFPALGRPMRAMVPHRMAGEPRLLLGSGPAAHAYLGDPAPLDFQHLDRQLARLEGLPDVGHPAQLRQQVAAEGLETLTLDGDAQPVSHLVDADLAAEHEDAVPLVGHGLAFDVVLVPDLTDDLLQQVLHGHQAGGAAVLVQDDRQLGLPALQVLQQLGHALALRHEIRGPHQRLQRRFGAGGKRHQILHEHH